MRTFEDPRHRFRVKKQSALRCSDMPPAVLSTGDAGNARSFR